MICFWISSSVSLFSSFRPGWLCCNHFCFHLSSLHPSPLLYPVFIGSLFYEISRVHIHTLNIFILLLVALLNQICIFWPQPRKDDKISIPTSSSTFVFPNLLPIFVSNIISTLLYNTYFLFSKCSPHSSYGEMDQCPLSGLL